MKLRFLAAGALLLLPLGLAVADETADQAFSLKLGGSHEARLGLPVGAESWAAGYQGAAKQPQVENGIRLEAAKGTLKAVFDNSFTFGPAGLDYRLGENYVAWNPDGWKLALGYQIFAWGSADGKNPTDNLNPRDYRSVAGDKIGKLSVLAAQAVWYPAEAWSIEAEFAPQAGASLFPIDRAAALRAQGFTVSEQSLGYGLDFAVAGGRVAYRSAAVDLSASYLYDLDAMSTPVVNGMNVGLERRRIHRIGLDAKTTLDRFGLWVEAAWSQTGNADPGNYTERLSNLNATLGGDCSFGPQDAGYLSLQYNVVWTPGYDYSPNTFNPLSDPRYLQKALLYQVAGVREEWLHSFIVAAHYNLAGDTVVPSVALSYSLPVNYDASAATRYGNLLLKAEIEFAPADAFKIALGGTFGWAWAKNAGQSAISLDQTDGAGVYTPQNSVYLSFKYQWDANPAK